MGRKTVATFLAVAVVAAIVAETAMRRASPPGTDATARARLLALDPAPETASLVLVTIDTLRADRLGCYGSPTARTPHLDRLAREGIVFEQATAAVPLTLPSHATLLTGLAPAHHQVLDNGAFSLAAGHTTLAERLHAAGFATGGFVGSFVLERRFGLAQGFDRFSDPFPARAVERRGDAVVDDALAWIDSVRDQRVFAWVHLYDPHKPYAAPDPYGARHPDDPYQGEVEYADSLVGRLRDHLEQTGRLGRTVVAVVADHGEGLGEHGEATHGFFVYDSTVAVPFIVRTPWGLAGRSRTQVAAVDLVPTLLDLVGIPPPPAGLDGQTLVRALLDPGADLGHAATAQTDFPRLHYGWHGLRALRDGRYKLIEAPRPELYDLARDAAETRDLYAAQTPRAQAMARALARVDAPPVPAEAGPDPAAVERIAALGYVGTRVDIRPGTDLADPKDKIHLYTGINEARDLADAGHREEAMARVRAVLAQDPDIVDAQVALGGWLEQAGRPDEAAACFRHALALQPDTEIAVFSLARVEAARGRGGSARAALGGYADALAARGPRPLAWYQLATVWLELADAAEAEAALHRALDQAPDLAAAHNALAALALDRGDVKEARARIDRALRADPGAATVRYNEGRVLEAEGRLPEAAGAYRAEIAHHPDHGRAHFNLARLLQKQGDRAGFVAELRAGIEQAPASGPCFFFLAHEELRAGRVEEATALARRGLAVDQTSEVAPLGYLVLADVYGQTGQPERAREALARARSLQAARASIQPLGG